MAVYPRRDAPLDIVQHLTTTVGPRLATSLAEAQAAAYVGGYMRRTGMRVSVDTFRAASSLGPGYRLLAALGFVAASLAGWQPWLALLLAVWGLLMVLSDGLVTPLPTLAPRRDSQNVVGTRASEKRPLLRVVLLAPLDTPNGSSARCFGGRQRIAVIGRVIAFSVLVGFNVALLWRQQNIWWYLQALPALYLLLTMFSSHYGDVRAAEASGAGAIAVLLDAAERLQHAYTTELWAVALGATATGSSGLRDFLARYPFSKEKTVFIALERIDDGQLTYVSREGILQQYNADAELYRLAADVDADDTTINTEPRTYTAAPSIATLLHAQGYRAFTLLTQAPLTPVHETSSDLGVYEQAIRLIVGMIQRLDTPSQSES